MTRPNMNRSLSPLLTLLSFLVLADINPVTDGRDAQGCAVAVLSTQRSQAAVGFGNPVKGDMRSMARPGAADEPGPGQCKSLRQSSSAPDLPPFLHPTSVSLLMVASANVHDSCACICRHRPTDRGPQCSWRGEACVIEGEECSIGGLYQGSCASERGCVGCKRKTPRPGPIRITHSHGKASQVSIQVHGWGTLGSRRKVAARSFSGGRKILHSENRAR